MAADDKKSVTVLGATGSVGRTTFGLLHDNPDKFRVEALTGGANWQELARQAKALAPAFVAIADEGCYAPLRDALSGLPIEVAAGSDSVVEAARRPADRVMAGVVGVAGLPSTMEAVRRGAMVAFANKECLVSAGEIMMEEVARAGATLLPVDSEHNAIFQVFEDQNRAQIDRILLTASGGPFRECTLAEMAGKTIDEALAHPNWKMGAKISIDSATMMNKGLEVIEARHLFDIEGERIEVVVHPQSIIHSLVAYRDGSMLAQLGAPDMATPISHALAWPDRMAANVRPLNLVEIAQLTFQAPDETRFPALRLAREVLAAGGDAPVTLNAANEIAVHGFLAGKIGFTDITRVVETMLAEGTSAPPRSIPEVLAMDADIRERTRARFDLHNIDKIAE